MKRNKLLFSKRNKYELLEGDTDTKDNSKNMNNYVGFENDRWYKVVNVGDNTVVHLDGSKLVCVVEDIEKVDVQRFQALAQDDGNFRLAARYQKSSSYVAVWDYLRHRSLLMQKKKSAAEISTQTWRSQIVPGMQCVYFIESVPHPDKCLKNVNTEASGVGQQVQIVNKTDSIIGDRFAHWRLEPEPLA